MMNEVLHIVYRALLLGVIVFVVITFFQKARKEKEEAKRKANVKRVEAIQ